MWWFLIATVAVNAATSLAPSSKSILEENITEISTEEMSYLKEEYDKVTEEYLDAFIAAQSPHIRRKRDLGIHSSMSLISDNTGVYRLSSINPLFAVCSPAVRMKFIDVGNWTYTVCVRSAIGNINATVFLGYLTTSGWQPLTSWYLPIDEAGASPNDVAVLYDNQILYVLVADSGNGEGIPLVKYDMQYHRMYMEHTVHNEYPTAVSIWDMKIDGRYHMAVAKSAGKEANDLSTEIYVYHWTGTYFDKYSSMQAFDVKDIEPFHIHGAAYLAIANHQAGKDDFVVDSEIFKYNLDKGTWISYQKMRTYGAMDWEFFTLGDGTGEEFFLAVANKYDAWRDMSETTYSTVIYKFMKNIFVPFQCLETLSANSVATFSKGSLFLLSVASEDGVYLFQYNGWRFVKASIQYTQRTLSFGVRALEFHRIKQMDDALILAVSNSEPIFMNEASVFELGFVYENPLRDWHGRSTEWCFNTLDSLQQPSAMAPLQDLKNIFFVDQKVPIVIDGSLGFDKSLETSKLIISKLTDKSTGNVYDNGYLETLLQLKSRLEVAKQRIDRISDVFNKAVTLNGMKEVTAELQFRDAQLVCDDAKCQTSNISTVFLNGEDVSNLKENIVFMDENQVITVPISVQNVEAGSIHVAGMINGIDINNVVTKSGNHNIIAPKTFTNLIDANDIEVGGLVDGLKFSPDTLLLRTGYQNITGRIVFKEIDTPWMTMGLLNGRDLNEFIQDVVLTNGYFEITGAKNFKEITAANLQVTPGYTVNGIDLMDLWTNTMWKDKDQTIFAPMSISAVHVENDLYVDGPINGLYIPSPELLFVNDNATIIAPQSIHNDVFISYLQVTNSLNGIKVDETGDLDILMKSGYQVITGQKTFDKIYLDDHSIVGGKVDGVDLSELYHTSLRRNSLVNTSQPWVFNNLVVKGPIIVRGRVSGFDVGEIYSRALKVNDAELSFDSFIFEDVITINELDSDDINGIDVTRDLVLVNKPQTIIGVKTFYDIVLEHDSVVLNHVNNIDLTFFNHTILRLGNQFITPKKTIVGNLKVKHLIVNGFVNGVDFRDVMAVGHENAVAGTKTFRNVTFQDLVVGNLEVAGLVNGINVVEIMGDTLTYDGQQTVTGTKTISGALKISSGSNLQTNSLNGIDMSALYDDAVWVDQKQVIKGKKTFTSAVVFNDLSVQGSIDGVTDWDMKHNWLLQGEDQVIQSQTTFTQPIAASEIFVNGLVNNINITRMASTIVKTNEPALIRGPVVFENVISLGDVTLSGKVQGIDLSEEVVDKTKDVSITGVKTFEDVIVGDLAVHGFVDGVSIQEICSTTVMLNQPQTLSIDAIGNVTFENGAAVSGLVSGVDIRKLYEEAVKSDAETFVNGLKTFEKLTIEGSLNVIGQFGGLDIDDLARKYMSLSHDQVIHSPMHFEELHVNGTISATSLYTEDQLIGNINVTELSSTVLKTIGEQTVEAGQAFSDVIFQDNVDVGGKVNGLEVPNSLMQRDKANSILSPKIFEQDVMVLGELRLGEGKTIQGVNLREWYMDAVKKDSGKYEIMGEKTFNDITMNDITVDGLINGIKFSEDSLLLTYGNQIITGPKVIYGDVIVHGSLNVVGLVNGTDLEDIASNAVRTDQNNTIIGLKTFKQPLTVNVLEAPSINGVDIGQLYNQVNADLDIEPLQKKMGMLDEVIKEMQVAFDNQALLFQYYELFQVFDTSGGYKWLYIPVENKEYLLLSDFNVMPNGCTSAVLYEYDYVIGKFTQTSQSLISSSAIAMKMLSIWGHTLVILANSKPNLECTNGATTLDLKGDADTANNIYFFDRDNSTFLPYQTLVTGPVNDIATFTDGSMACIVFLEIYNSYVACALDTIHDFTMYEHLQSYGGYKATIAEVDGDVIMVITRFDASSTNYEQCIDIYRWDRNAKAFGDPIQMINIRATSVLLIPVDHGNSFDLFLAMSEDKIPQIDNDPRLFIYKYDGNLFYKNQEIKDHGVLDYTTLPSGEVVLFVMNTKYGEIEIYQHKGVSEFQKIDTITSAGAQTLYTFKRNDPGDTLNHYVALAGLPCSLPDALNEYYKVKILKSKIKGKM